MENMYQTDVIYVNGKKMTQKELKAMIKAKSIDSKPKKKAKKTAIQEIPSWVKTIVRHAGPIKSLAAYYDNGYKQWGKIARVVIQEPQIYRPFLAFRSKVCDMTSIINEINIIGKHDEKAIFAYLQKLSWKLDDIKKDMDSLYHAVQESGVLYTFKDRECINGTGRRLGLAILMERTYQSIRNMNDTINDIEKVAVQGLDAMAYTDVNKNRCFRHH